MPAPERRCSDMTVAHVSSLPFKEGDLIEGEDGRRYRVSESYPETITLVPTDSLGHSRTISKPSFNEFKKVKP